MQAEARLAPLLARHKELSPLFLLAALLLLFSVFAHSFFSVLNASNLLSTLPELGIIALGMTLLLTAGEFDLSVGAVFALAPILMLLLVHQGGLPLVLALLISLAVAVVIGVVNGLLVTREGITSFLVTLSMLLIVRGISLYMTSGFPQEPLEGASLVRAVLVGGFDIGDLHLFASLIWFAVLIVLCHFLLRRARLGNWIIATGSNPSAALARGVPVDAVKVGLFAFTSFLSGLAGVMSALRVGSASPNAGTSYELEVIAMVVVGGTALNGGRGTILGTVIGVLLLRIIRNGIIMVGVPGLAFNIFVGVIILAMLIIHARLERSTARR